MIISASRRTDIPNYYMDWFLHRLREGYVLVRNPFHSRQVSRVSLLRGNVDCIVFWSKNPHQLLKRLPELGDIPFYVQFTLNPYGAALEPGLPPVSERVQTFLALSRAIGKRRMVWRYDPIIVSAAFPAEYHLEQFRRLSAQLAENADECIISFMDEYKNTRRNEAALRWDNPSAAEMEEIAAGFAAIAAGYGLRIRTCAEEVDFSGCGVLPAQCIDAERIREISGREVPARKDASQRKSCGCVKSVDIGVYNTCPNACLYCYANYNPAVIRQSCAQHDAASPLLVGQLNENDRITVRK